MVSEKKSQDISITHPSLKIKVDRSNNELYYSQLTMERLLLDVQENTIDKAVVKEFIKLNQELINSLASKEDIEKNPLLQKVRDKIKELNLE